jgi:ribonuclease D
MAKPKILLYDLEITPTLGWTYGMYETNVLRVEREPYIMCFSYKWYGEKGVKCLAQPDFPTTYKRHPYDDSHLAKELWKLLDAADIVVAHNAARFDNRVANERFLAHRLGPPSPYKTVDTLQIAKRYFRHGSNSLDNLCQKLEIGEKSKVKHSSLWYDCVFGDSKAWKQMVRYCKRDTEMLDELYTRLRPFMANHPNVAHLAGLTNGCPKCGSVNVQYRGSQRSNVATYRRVHCQDCGAWSRERTQEQAIKPAYVNISPSL